MLILGIAREEYDNIMGNLEEIKKVITQKEEVDCDASKISKKDYEEYFRTYLIELNTKWMELKGYKDQTKSNILLAEVIRYSDVMMENYKNNRIDEKAYVQSEIKGTFWNNIKPVFNNNTVTLENEREFALVIENNRRRCNYHGKTDHVVKLSTSEIRAMTIEDKFVGKVYENRDYAQARAEMESEIRDMFQGFNYVPVEFCGILQNGCDWIFLFHTMCEGRALWQRVQSPPTFNKDTHVIDEGACAMVAQFLEHACFVADNIILEMTGNVRRIHVPSITSIPEKEEEEEEDDDDDDVNYDDVNNLTSDFRKLSTVPSNTTQSNAKNSKPVTKGNSNKTSGKKKAFGENKHLILQLTKENVAKQPYSYIKSFVANSVSVGKENM